MNNVWHTSKPNHNKHVIIYTSNNNYYIGFYLNHIKSWVVDNPNMSNPCVLSDSQVERWAEIPIYEKQIEVGDEVIVNGDRAIVVGIDYLNKQDLTYDLLFSNMVVENEDKKNLIPTKKSYKNELENIFNQLELEDLNER